MDWFTWSWRLNWKRFAKVFESCPVKSCNRSGASKTLSLTTGEWLSSLAFCTHKVEVCSVMADARDLFGILVHVVVQLTSTLMCKAF